MRQMGNDAIALLKAAAKDHPQLAETVQLYLSQVCHLLECFPKLFSYYVYSGTPTQWQ